MKFCKEKEMIVRGEIEAAESFSLLVDVVEKDV